MYCMRFFWRKMKSLYCTVCDSCAIYNIVLLFFFNFNFPFHFRSFIHFFDYNWHQLIANYDYVLHDENQWFSFFFNYVWEMFRFWSETLNGTCMIVVYIDRERFEASSDASDTGASTSWRMKGRRKKMMWKRENNSDQRFIIINESIWARKVCG